MERDVTLEESRFPQENQCKLQGIMSVMKFAWIISPMINTKVSCFRENCPKQDKCWLIFLNPDIIYFVFWLLFGISQSNWKTFFFFLFFFYWPLLTLQYRRAENVFNEWHHIFDVDIYWLLWKFTLKWV